MSTKKINANRFVAIDIFLFCIIINIYVYGKEDAVLLKKTLSKAFSLLIVLVVIISCCPVSVSAASAKRSLSEYYQFSYDDYMNYLKSHEHDNYYLGTPYRSGNWRSPNGDRSYNGSAGMNCSGFVWHVLKSCIRRAGHNPNNYQVLSFTTPRGWYGVLEDNNIRYYVFNNKYEALRSGVMSKGDIIMMFCNSAMLPSGQNHIGIYWGDGSSDVFWHSAGRANYISVIRSGGAIVKFVVAKMKPSDGSLKVGLKDQDGNALTGGKFGIYNSSGSLYRTVSVGESVRLPFGKYTVSQTAAPDGYKADTSKKRISVTLSKSDFNLTFTSRKKCGAFTAYARAGRYMPSLGKNKLYSLSGFVFDIFSDAECTKRVSQITTGANGSAVFGKEDGKYILPEGSVYYIKPAKENSDKFKNLSIPETDAACITVQTDKNQTVAFGKTNYVLCEALGTIRIDSQPQAEFWLFEDEECTTPALSLNTDGAESSSEMLNIAIADGSGRAYFGFDTSSSGFSAYRMDCGVYYFVDESGSKTKLTVRSGCLTDAATGECIAEILRGDCDLNGVVTASDARMALRAAARLENICAEQLSAGDLDADGRISPNEARRILRYCAKLSSEL